MHGDCALPLGLGILIGAVVTAAGMSIVAVLVLRALGEWREIQDRGAAVIERAAWIWPAVWPSRPATPP